MLPGALVGQEILTYLCTGVLPASVSHVKVLREPPGRAAAQAVLGKVPGSVAEWQGAITASPTSLPGRGAHTYFFLCVALCGCCGNGDTSCVCRGIVGFASWQPEQRVNLE